MIKSEDYGMDEECMPNEERQLVHELGLHILDYARLNDLSVSRVIGAMEICKKLFIDLLYKTEP